MSIARALPHDAAPLHVTGAARYVDDIPTPADTLHLAFGLSELAHGTITQIDLAEARTAAGVVAAITAEDLPFANNVSASVEDEPLLAQGQVHYLGQPVFLVVARSYRAARKAARLGRLTCKAAPPILSIEDALAANSRFGEAPLVYTRGQPEAAIARCPHRLEGSLNLGGQEHFYLEGQAALALPQENGDMLVHASSQHPTEIQHKVAEALGIPMHGVRVEVRRMGGGFGGKESQGNAVAVACAVAAHLTGHPCKMRYDRDDDMRITGKRHDFRIDYQVGFDDQGRIGGLDIVHYVRGGWSQDLTLPVADRAMLHTDNAYFLPHVRITSHRLRTNTQSATAFRGFGGPQGMAGIERIVDHIAHYLQRDPLLVRHQNYYAASKETPKDPSSQQRPLRNTTPYGQAVKDFILHELTDQLAQDANYHARRAALAKWNAENPVLKKGIALTPVKFGISFTLTHLNQAGALVHIYQDGSIQINHGGTEMGQGLFQKVAQVAASRFDLPPEKVRITATDTGKVPNTSATAASAGSDLNGMAVKVACDILRARMAKTLAAQHQTTPDTLRFHKGCVHVAGNTLSFAQAAAQCYQERTSLSATGFYRTPNLQWDRVKGQGRPFYYFAYGAALTEVVIDTLSGEYRILSADILHDVGASLNPAVDIGQIEGGYVQGAGWLTIEELVWDEKGALRTHAPSTYKIPACSDRPERFTVRLFAGANCENTIYRSKAVGEPPFMLGISAFMALSDAVARCGDGRLYPALDAPATAERILLAVRRQQGIDDV
ncbi:MAG: xanthine dehydrogenase molybdopterin binding subunit [Rhodobacteraceae bacterium]|nr:xanthine dehydrogenase molybdopterin binding subunit [Paracoccaceae bacterium]